MIPSRNRKTLAELIRHAGGEPSPVLVRWALNTRRASYAAQSARERRRMARGQE